MRLVDRERVVLGPNTVDHYTNFASRGRKWEPRHVRRMFYRGRPTGWEVTLGRLSLVRLYERDYPDLDVYHAPSLVLRYVGRRTTLKIDLTNREA